MINSLEELKIFQHNDLIMSLWQMDTISLKIFELAVAHIDHKKKDWDGTVVLSKKKIFKMFQATDNDRYFRFQRHLRKLRQQGLFIELPNDRKAELTIVPYIEWGKIDSDNQVVLRFSPEIKPYLFNLKESFTSYLLNDIEQLTSKYSIIFYKIFNMYINLFNRYKNNNHRNPVIPLKYIRKVTGTVQEYERFFNFEKRVLKRAIDEINNNSSLKCSYTKIKEGQKIDAIEFHIERKETAILPKQKEMEYDYQTRKEEKIKELLPKALQNEYVQLLVRMSLLDTFDIESIVEVYENVIPVYNLISEIKEHSIYNHLSYVEEHMIPTIKTEKNIARYLETAAKQYFEKLAS